VSDTLTEDDVTWNPTTIIKVNDLVGEVAKLREKPGGDIYVYGSITLVRSLLAAGQVDELILFIEPITLGGGKRLFPDDGAARNYELVSAEIAKTGVLACTYRPGS
jgi:dihydrofolate reductase